MTAQAAGQHFWHSDIPSLPHCTPSISEIPRNTFANVAVASAATTGAGEHIPLR
jgi:hypothetical protein